MNSFDTLVFHSINHLAGKIPFLDHVMIFFAVYSPEMFVLVLLVSWFILPRADEQVRHGLVMAVVAGLLAFGINNLIGVIWYRPRPFVALSPGQFHQLIPHVSDASFPSDHVALGFGLAAGSWRRARGWSSWVLAVVTILAMFARVYVGVHWPTDVIGGMVVGIVAGIAIQPASKYLFSITRLALRILHMGRYGKAT